jgi:hypothetical protein
LLSPYGLAFASTLVFLLAWLTPPDYYSNIVGEKDLVFLEPTSFLLFILCVAAFLAGVAAIDIFFPAATPPMARMRVRFSPLLFLLLPLLIGLLVTFQAIALLLRDNPDIFDLIIAQQGSQLKENLDIHQPLGLASIWLLGICWWASWRRDQLELDRRWKRWLVTSTIAIGILAILAYSALKLGRGEFMPVMTGTVLLYLLRRQALGRLSRLSFLRTALVSASLLVVTFLLFSSVRGAEDPLADIVRYTVTSYNRLAALVTGRMHYPHAGSGVYFSSFLSFNATLNQLVPIREVFHWPTFQEVWDSEFTSTWQAGLDGYVIWSGTFGYLYSDFGWFSPLVLVLHGLVCGGLWRSVRQGHIAGILLCPWCGFCILFWFGTNFFFDTKMVVLALASAMLVGYERLWAAKTVSAPAWRLPGGMRLRQSDS